MKTFKQFLNESKASDQDDVIFNIIDATLDSLQEYVPPKDLLKDEYKEEEVEVETNSGKIKKVKKKVLNDDFDAEDVTYKDRISKLNPSQKKKFTNSLMQRIKEEMMDFQDDFDE